MHSMQLSVSCSSHPSLFLERRARASVPGRAAQLAPPRPFWLGKDLRVLCVRTACLTRHCKCVQHLSGGLHIITCRVEQLRLLSKAEQAGLLSLAERSGLTLSFIERSGLLSKAESLGLLSLATDR